MRGISRFLGLCTFVWSLACHAGNLPAAVDIPGTGFSIRPPAGTRLLPAGSAFVDATGEVVLFIAAGNTGATDIDPLMRGVYPHAPEVLKSGGLDGKLYMRTRARDGGGYDGWLLYGKAGGAEVYMMASYTGNDPDRFRQLRDSVLSLAYKGGKPDPDVAMGVRVAPRGLRATGDSSGNLNFTQTGRPKDGGPSLLIMALPVPPAKAAALVPAGCETMIKAAMERKPFSGPIVVQHAHHQTCEAWNKDPARPTYLAVIRLDSGGLLNAIGSAPASQFESQLPVFRDAIAKLEAIRK